MKVTADQNICASSGQCVAIAPRVFDQRDEDGVVELVARETEETSAAHQPCGEQHDRDDGLPRGELVTRHCPEW